VKYDLHVHTSRYSPCAVSSPEAVCRSAIRRGLTGFALTEHDMWWPVSEYEELKRLFPELVIFHGVEYAVPEGHFLVFLPDPAQELPHLNGLPSLVAAVRRHGGVIIWAHPFRYSRTLPDWLPRLSPDAMELSSSNMSSAVQSLAREIAAKWQIPGFHNSDAHHAASLGLFYNDIRVKLTDNRALVDYIKALSQFGAGGRGS
jgi:predicted metal-dependent phosphoesterase TrpH